ncbi:MAG TPA: hypothetical protein VGO52_19045 [Hyphomonadaceae bacterium]|jgi:hypothetical protein|nr:hypothetical protein [Hyphomonadaceae bacterium]
MALSPRAAAVCIAVSLAVSGMATSAAQQAKELAPMSDTVKAVVENGATMRFSFGPTAALSIELIYNKDGTLLAEPGDFAGTWEANGAQLCMTVSGYAENQCLTYPDGKKSGDTFDIPTKAAPITITIN